MPDRQNGGGRWLQRTADRSPGYPEPAYQHIPPKPDGGADWPELPNGRVVVEIVEEDSASSGAVPQEDDWAAPDWTRGASVRDFLRHIESETWRHFGNTIPTECTVAARVEASYRIPQIERATATALRILLDKTAPGQGFVLKYLRQDFNSDWVPLPQAWRDKLYRFGSFRPGVGITSCFDPLGSTITYELAIFKSAAESSPQPATAIPLRNTNRGGRPPKYDWESFHITRIALIEGELPDRLDLHRRMVEWCAKNWPEQPEESETRKRIGRL